MMRAITTGQAFVDTLTLHHAASSLASDAQLVAREADHAIEQGRRAAWVPDSIWDRPRLAVKTADGMHDPTWEGANQLREAAAALRPLYVDMQPSGLRGLFASPRTLAGVNEQLRAQGEAVEQLATEARQAADAAKAKLATVGQMGLAAQTVEGVVRYNWFKMPTAQFGVDLDYMTKALGGEVLPMTDAVRRGLDRGMAMHTNGVQITGPGAPAVKMGSSNMF